MHASKHSRVSKFNKLFFPIAAVFCQNPRASCVFPYCEGRTKKREKEKKYGKGRDPDDQKARFPRLIPPPPPLCVIKWRLLGKKTKKRHEPRHFPDSASQKKNARAKRKRNYFVGKFFRPGSKKGILFIEALIYFYIQSKGIETHFWKEFRANLFSRKPHLSLASSSSILKEFPSSIHHQGAIFS